MNNIQDLIGKQARRVTFSIQNDNEYYMLYSVIEILHDDMQDSQEYREGNYLQRSSCSSRKNAYNIYMTIDWLDLTENFIKNPTQNFEVFKTKLRFYEPQLLLRPSASEPPYILQDSYHDNKSEIQNVLPLRLCTKALYAYLDQNKIGAKIIQSNEYLKKQLSEVSVKYYGADLSLFPDHLGNMYIIQYNEWFRHINFTASQEPKGIYVYFDYKKDVNGNLRLRLSNKNKAGFYTFDIDCTINTTQNAFFIELPSEPDVMSVKVLDPENRILYYNDELVFIRSIQTRMNVKSKDVNIVTPNNGNRSSEVVEKFSSEKFSIGKERDVAAELGETTTQNAYRILEDALEFILIDGDKSKKNENIHKAKEVVKKIISRATTRCIICDPYFNLNDLTEFVFTMPQLDVDVRVMSSKAYIGKNAEEAKYNSLQINNEITNFNNRVGTKIGFRLLTGSSPLHDRFIIVDDDVWMLGSSFNEFGNRTTTISKVPKESCRQIYGMAESWWTSDEYTISLEGYGRS